MMVGNIFDAIQGILLENSRLLEKIFHKASLLKLAFVLWFLCARLEDKLRNRVKA